MQYIFGILMAVAISYYVGAAVGRYLKKRNTNSKYILPEEENHTEQQKEFFKGSGMDYRGRKTSKDWQDWYDRNGEDILNKKTK